MTTKIITQLTGQAQEALWNEQRGTLQTVIVETVPGHIRHVTLGEAGVLIRAGTNTVGIPINELVRLAEAADEKMKPPVKPASMEE